MTESGEKVWSTIAAIREKGPLVHSVTNLVSMDIMANMLLAVGASPVMAHATEEVAAFAKMAGAVNINMGTLDAPWVESMQAAASAAGRAGTPWLFDPVGVGATAYRNGVAASLIAYKPTIIRGNASEILALAGGTGGKGVDASHGVEEAHAVARDLAERTGAVIAVTGASDFVTDGARQARIDNGHPMMARVTATGCALTAVMGAAVAVAGEPFAAACHALVAYGIAGELAARSAAGPGSFRVAFLDAIANLDRPTLDARIKLA